MASFKELFAPSNPATSSHFTLGFSVTTAPFNYYLNAVSPPPSINLFIFLFILYFELLFS